MSLDKDWQIRLAAMAKLEELRRTGDGLVRAPELTAGFQFEGERIPFWNSQRGIFRPAQLKELGVALSIRTAPLIEGVTPAYDDEVAADGKGWFGYKYEKTDPDKWSNVAVRRAGELGRPLIYLYGVAPSTYEPIFPVYVTNDDPTNLTFRVEVGAPFSVKSPESATLLMDAPMRAYQTVAVKRRLHQHRFRELVLGAYKRRCTMCNLGHTQLLDAAHIIPDHDDRGKPEIPNGLALCKIHHSAYDVHILGISPDLVVHVREDILREIDGPMLEHGLKGMANRRIVVPRAAALRPKREFLEERFDQFSAA